jgi:hypothetical protein
MWCGGLHGLRDRLFLYRCRFLDRLALTICTWCLQTPRLETSELIFSEMHRLE